MSEQLINYAGVDLSGIKKETTLPPSERLKYIVQVPVYKELPGGAPVELSRLGLNLLSIVNAVQTWKDVDPLAPEKVEVIYNINNPKGVKTPENEIAIDFINAINTDISTASIMDSFPWIPKLQGSGGEENNRIAAVYNFYARIIDDARAMMGQGMRIRAIDNTNGEYDNSTQGARRKLLAGLAEDDFEKNRTSHGANQNEQWHIPMDADMILSPNYFVQLDELTKNYVDGPAVIKMPMRFVRPKSYARKDVMEMKSFKSIPITEIVSMGKDFPKKGEPLNMDEIREYLLERNVSEEDINLFLEIGRNSEQLAGVSLDKSYNGSFFLAAKKAYASLESEEGALDYIRMQSILVDFYFSIKSIERKLEENDTSSDIGMFIPGPSYAINSSAYEKSGGWNSKVEIGEDAEIIGKLVKDPEISKGYLSSSVLNVSDRKRPESWSGKLSGRSAQGDLMSAIENDEWWTRLRDAATTINKEEKIVETEDLSPRDITDVFWKTLEKRKDTMNEQELQLIDTIRNSVPKYDDPIIREFHKMLLLSRKVEINLGQYPNLSSFISSLAKRME